MLLTLAVLGGCAGARDASGYYAQSTRGHLELLGAARPVEDWIASDTTPPALRERLVLAQRMRRFAASELHLPDNASYQRYADLKRPAAIWNVAAAPPFSLTLQTWCFPIAGCIGYRGYFTQADAQALAADLEKQGLEVRVFGVPAYSTLGWSNWIGGDPLLNTFIGYPEGDLARLLFHELAHQVVYVTDDTMFNESFATAVERLGSARWLAQHASPSTRSAFAEAERRRAEFRDLALATRRTLAAIYEQNTASAQYPPGLAAIKIEAMAAFRSQYADLRTRWLASGVQPAQVAGYDQWVAQANNAAFATQAAYDELVPGFEAVFAQVNGDWPHFYAAVRDLARQPRAERRRRLADAAAIGAATPATTAQPSDNIPKDGTALSLPVHSPKERPGA